MTLSNGGITGIVIGSLVFGIIVIAVLLHFLRCWLRGPIKSKRILKRLDGKTVVITGGNCGIGKETARDLYNRGAEVVILSRDVGRGNAAAEDIKVADSKDGGTIKIQQCDLSSFQSIRNCATELLASLSTIDILINNAGIMMTPQGKTEDGFELQFGTNHLGHFLLTELLMPKIMKTAAAASGNRPRVVILSSLAHKRGIMHWDDLNLERGYNSITAYGQSKLANVLHAKELARRVPEIGVYSLHPGVINTNLARDIRKKWYGCFVDMFNFLIKTPFHGAQTTLYCALDDSLEGKSGLYYSDCKEATPSQHALNENDQKRLWTTSLKLVGLEEDAA